MENMSNFMKKFRDARNSSSSVKSKNTWVQGSGRAVKVQSLLAYRETVLSEKTEAIFSGKPKALEVAFSWLHLC